MEKLSVFGGTGFIGGRYCYRNQDTIVIDRESNTPLSKDALYLISTTHNYNVNTDVHLDINTNLNKLMDVLPNVDGTFNFISSWFVYGKGYGNQHLPAHEYAYCNPTGFYSITKKAAEDLIVSYCETFGKSYRIMRLCNVIGGDPKAGKQKNALEYILQKIVNNETVEIYTGDNYRNFLHVDDVCDAIKLVTEEGKYNDIYNIGSHNSERLIDIVQYAKEKVNSESRIKLVAPPRFHTIVQSTDFFMDCKKLRGLGFVQKYSMYDTIDQILFRLTSK